ncbi:MAG: hypothetical protein LBH75_08570 [Treponema sp.]|jgi:hypothetical protein|nr:hypothetical protein [Treponema sp.]
MGRPRKKIDELKESGTYRPSLHDRRIVTETVNKNLIEMLKTTYEEFKYIHGEIEKLKKTDITKKIAVFEKLEKLNLQFVKTYYSLKEQADFPKKEENKKADGIDAVLRGEKK